MDRRAAEANKENNGEEPAFRVLNQEEEMRVLQQRVQNFNIPTQNAAVDAQENQALSSDEGTAALQAQEEATSRSLSPAPAARQRSQHMRVIRQHPIMLFPAIVNVTPALPRADFGPDIFGNNSGGGLLR